MISAKRCGITQGTAPDIFWLQCLCIGGYHSIIGLTTELSGSPARFCCARGVGMNEFVEIAWREALKAKGKDWVRAELQRRPGQPQDVVYDIVFEEPLPTRDFCLQWCAEEENKLFHISWHTLAALIALFITVCCGVAAVNSLNSQRTPPSAVAAAQAPAPRVMPSEPPNYGAANASGAHFAGESDHRLPDICAYQTYQTDECKQPQN